MLAITNLIPNDIELVRMDLNLVLFVMVQKNFNICVPKSI